MISSVASGWTTQQLVDLAHKQGFLDVTARLIETWRGQDLLPRPQRIAQAGLVPVWVSPPGTDEQLRQLCTLRRDRNTKNPDLLRLQLWLSGGDQPLSLIKSSLQTVLADVAALLEKETAAVIKRQGLHGEPADVRRQALDAIAGQAAGLRGINTVLDRLPSARGHRVPGFRVLLHLFVEGEAPSEDVGNGDDVDRTLGVLPRARYDRVEDAPPWHDGQTDLDHMARIVSLPALRAAVELAIDDDLRYARRAVAPLTRGSAIFSRLISTMYSDKHAGFTLLKSMPQAPYTDPLVVALVVSLRHSDLSDNLTALTDTIERSWRSVASRLDQLLLMPGRLFKQKTARGDQRQAALLLRVLDQFKPRPGQSQGDQ